MCVNVGVWVGVCLWVGGSKCGYVCGFLCVLPWMPGWMGEWVHTPYVNGCHIMCVARLVSQSFQQPSHVI